MCNLASVKSPDSESMEQLCDRLKQWSGRWVHVDDWPGESLRLCGRAGVYRWFLPQSQGGLGWSEEDQTRGYLRLAEADLTTTFVITQYIGAIRRIAGSKNGVVGDAWLQRLIQGDAFATVGISHLTTSRQHLTRPALTARETGEGYVLEGQAPWVTGAPHGDLFVIGATLEDGREILVAVPGDAAGVRPGSGYRLVALSASCTDRVEFENVVVDQAMVLSGPIENVLQTGTGAGTGGLQTSTLAIGLARAAVHFLVDEASRRDDLSVPADELARELDQLEARLLRAAAGDPALSPSDIRGAANHLVMRTTQAAMTAAKGAGFIEGHPVGRWCREALFFLVWSCPKPVSHAHLCELAFGVQ